MLCRQEGYFDLSDIQTAVFEYNGRLTILPKSHCRPMTPKDMNLNPAPAELCTEVIIDGRVMDKNLNRAGLDRKWLEKQLKALGYKSPKEVLLGVITKDKTLTLYNQKKT